MSNNQGSRAALDDVEPVRVRSAANSGRAPSEHARTARGPGVSS